MKYIIVAVFLFSASIIQAGLVSHVNVNISIVEKHAENVSGCAEGSQNYLVLGLKNSAGAITYVWIATSNLQYKDLESMAFTALASRIKVTVQADNDLHNQVCGWTGGKVRFLTLYN